jgi:hypothetical protein
VARTLPEKNIAPHKITKAYSMQTETERKIEKCTHKKEEKGKKGEKKKRKV